MTNLVTQQKKKYKSRDEVETKTKWRRSDGQFEAICGLSSACIVSVMAIPVQSTQHESDIGVYPEPADLSDLLDISHG